MDYLKIMLISSFFICSCNNAVDSVNNQERFIANAGDDQITYVGSYAILDPSKSNNVGEKITIIDWVQDKENPEEIRVLSYSTLQEKNVVGFQKEGKYKFTLRINCESGNVYTDDIVINVMPRQNSLIEDINLEIVIRNKLGYKEGELTIEKLQLLDSLSKANYLVLKDKIKSIKGIEYCTNLKYLSLFLESIFDLKPLSNLIKLEDLNLNQNYTIEDVTPLSNLINLKRLILYSNPIKDISPLRGLINLTELDLNFTQIDNINSLYPLINLEILQIGGDGIGQFNNIEPLNNLKKLKKLWLSQRGINDIKPLEDLINLEILELSYNNLIEISSVSKMKKLRWLGLVRNKIKNISGIKNLESLVYFNAIDNQIKDINEMEYFSKNIEVIGLSNNQIEDIYPIVKIQELKNGVSIYLTNNPLNQKSINEYIPLLKNRGVNIVY